MSFMLVRLKIFVNLSHQLLQWHETEREAAAANVSATINQFVAAYQSAACST